MKEKWREFYSNLKTNRIIRFLVRSDAIGLGCFTWAFFSINMKLTKTNTNIRREICPLAATFPLLGTVSYINLIFPSQMYSSFLEFRNRFSPLPNSTCLVAAKVVK